MTKAFGSYSGLVAWLLLACSAACAPDATGPVSRALEPAVWNEIQLHSGECPTCRPPTTEEWQALDDALARIMGANADCSAALDYLRSIWGTPSLVIDDALDTYNDWLGWHEEFDELKDPDIGIGVYHVNNDPTRDVAVTLAHEAIHHLQPTYTEAETENAAWQCVA